MSVGMILFAIGIAILILGHRRINYDESAQRNYRRRRRRRRCGRNMVTPTGDDAIWQTAYSGIYHHSIPPPPPYSEAIVRY